MTESKTPKTSVSILDRMVGKPRRTVKFNFDVDGDELCIEFEAMSRKEFDQLVETHPPTSKQKRDGMNWNVDTFYPALICACAISPTFTAKEVSQLINSESWSYGELSSLFAKVINLNTDGINASFT